MLVTTQKEHYTKGADPAKDYAKLQSNCLQFGGRPFLKWGGLRKLRRDLFVNSRPGLCVGVFFGMAALAPVT